MKTFVMSWQWTKEIKIVIRLQALFPFGKIPANAHDFYVVHFTGVISEIYFIFSHTNGRYFCHIIIHTVVDNEHVYLTKFKYVWQHYTRTVCLSTVSREKLKWSFVATIGEVSWGHFFSNNVTVCISAAIWILFLYVSQ